MSIDAAPLSSIDINQALLDASPAHNYLEIGVDNGNSFIPIRASRKWGVDPAYTLSWKRRAKYAVFSRLRLRIEQLFRMPSDAFFRRFDGMLQRRGIDVCFIDGLHTYDQTLRDVLNALRHLRRDGVIVVHDCNPTTPLMACPADSINEVIAKGIPGWKGAWTGDVWKAIVHLRSLRRDLCTFVLDCDTGFGIITRGRSEAGLQYSESEIRRMEYETLAADRVRLLDLRPAAAFDAFVAERFGR